MDQNKIPKPNKLIIAIIYLSISYTTLVLNLGLYIYDSKAATYNDADFAFCSFMICTVIINIWLTYEICKGRNWARIYLLIFEIVYFQIIFLNFGYSKKDLIDALYVSVHLFFAVLGIFLLFHKDTSIWFKQIKQRENKKSIISKSTTISLILFYFGCGICTLNFIISYFIPFKLTISYVVQDILKNESELILLLFITINILFIQAIRKGSKSAGIIYLALIIIAQLTNNTIILGDLLFYFSARPSSTWNLLGYMQLTIQGIGFIILFQEDIIYYISKLIERIKLNFCSG